MTVAKYAKYGFVKHVSLNKSRSFCNAAWTELIQIYLFAIFSFELSEVQINRTF